MEKDEILNNMIADIKDFKTRNPNGIVIIRGATATGKTGFSIKLAEHFDVEIISADSRQIYKYMNIGTDKIGKEYTDKIKHYMIDIVEPDVIYTAGEWKIETEKIIEDILSRGKLPIVVGGTGLYVDMLYKNFTLPNVEPDYEYRAGLEKLEENEQGILHKKLFEIDPVEAGKLHPKSTRHIIRALEIFEKTGKTKTEVAQEQEVKWPLLMIGLWREKDDTNKRINSRIKEMFDGGLVDEVRALLDKGYDKSLPAMLGIGYKEVIGYLEKEYNLEKAQELLRRNTHHYAKRQRTWFRRYIGESKAMPKKNVEYKLYILS